MWTSQRWEAEGKISESSERSETNRAQDLEMLVHKRFGLGSAQSEGLYE